MEPGYVDWASLELTEIHPPASASGVLGSKTRDLRHLAGLFPCATWEPHYGAYAGPDRETVFLHQFLKELELQGPPKCTPRVSHMSWSEQG